MGEETYSTKKYINIKIKRWQMAYSILFFLTNTALLLLLLSCFFSGWNILFFIIMEICILRSISKQKDYDISFTCKMQPVILFDMLYVMLCSSNKLIIAIASFCGTFSFSLFGIKNIICVSILLFAFASLKKEEYVGWQILSWIAIIYFFFGFNESFVVSYYGIKFMVISSLFVGIWLMYQDAASVVYYISMTTFIIRQKKICFYNVIFTILLCVLAIFVKANGKSMNYVWLQNCINKIYCIPMLALVVFLVLFTMQAYLKTKDYMMSMSKEREGEYIEGIILQYDMYALIGAISIYVIGGFLIKFYFLFNIVLLGVYLYVFFKVLNYSIKKESPEQILKIYLLVGVNVIFFDFCISKGLYINCLITLILEIIYIKSDVNKFKQIKKSVIAVTFMLFEAVAYLSTYYIGTETMKGIGEPDIKRIIVLLIGYVFCILVLILTGTKKDSDPRMVRCFCYIMYIFFAVYLSVGISRGTITYISKIENDKCYITLKPNEKNIDIESVELVNHDDELVRVNNISSEEKMTNYTYEIDLSGTGDKLYLLRIKAEDRITIYAGCWFPQMIYTIMNR